MEEKEIGLDIFIKRLKELGMSEAEADVFLYGVEMALERKKKQKIKKTDNEEKK